MTIIQRDVGQLIQAETAYINQESIDQPLSVEQWNAIRQRVKELEKYGFNPAFIYRYLMNCFAVEETKQIPSSKFIEVQTKIEEYVQQKLQEKRKSRQMHELLKLSNQSQDMICQHALSKFGTSTFKLLNVDQLQQLLDFAFYQLESSEEKEIIRKKIQLGSFVIEWYKISN